jgi:hypothetical protein
MLKMMTDGSPVIEEAVSTSDLPCGRHAKIGGYGRNSSEFH